MSCEKILTLVFFFNVLLFANFYYVDISLLGILIIPLLRIVFICFTDDKREEQKVKNTSAIIIIKRIVKGVLFWMLVMFPTISYFYFVGNKISPCLIYFDIIITIIMNSRNVFMIFLYFGGGYYLLNKIVKK